MKTSIKEKDGQIKQLKLQRDELFQESQRVAKSTIKHRQSRGPEEIDISMTSQTASAQINKFQQSLLRGSESIGKSDIKPRQLRHFRSPEKGSIQTYAKIKPQTNGWLSPKHTSPKQPNPHIINESKMMMMMERDATMLSSQEHRSLNASKFSDILQARNQMYPDKGTYGDGVRMSVIEKADDDDDEIKKLDELEQLAMDALNDF